MKKGLLMLLVTFSIINLGNIETNQNDITSNYIVYNNVTTQNENKRNYNYLYYKNDNNYIVTTQDDIKKAIYNGLNDNQNTITLYCKYSNNYDCLNDFYYIYENKTLMRSINNYVNPYNKYSDTRYRININNGNIKIEIDIEKKYTEEQINKINQKLDKYLNKLNLDKMTNEDKIKWAHDFIIDRDKYDEVAAEKGYGDAYSAYGAIINKKAICLGYAEAMAIILDKFNIPNILISNHDHIWNLVYSNDKWLHLDVTWDDPTSFNGKNLKIYDYYLITSEKLQLLDNSHNHKFNSEYYTELINN